MKHLMTSIILVLFTLLLHSADDKHVDRYGQFTGENWSEKVTTDDQLKERAVSEWKLISETEFNTKKFDRFGGLLEFGEYPKTGSFYLKKIKDRWWLVTPEGHLYFLIGCDAVDYKEGGYSSPLFDQHGTAREVFDELPDTKEYPGAVVRNRVNFIAANLKRKYGSGFEQKVVEINRKRLIHWGFNSTAKWGWGYSSDLPFIEDTFLGAKAIPGSDRIDVYDSGLAKAAEQCAQKYAELRGSDPMLVAFATENENGWGYDDVRALAKGKDCASKEKLFQFLSERHGKIKARKMMMGEIPLEEIKSFIFNASRHYHKTVREIFRKYAPEKLWFGASHCGAQSAEWIAGSAPFVDAIMLNEYNVCGIWTKQLMPMLKQLGRPIFITEFSFVCDQRGMSYYGDFSTVEDQKSRGLCYRHYTENFAKNPLCIGFGYFIFYDQPITRRNVPGGECHNFGLVDVTDTPYADMLDHVRAANANLYLIHAGKHEPFQMEEPWMSFSKREVEQILGGNAIPGSCSKMLGIDWSAPEKFGGCSRRVKLYESYLSHARDYSGIYSTGTIPLSQKSIAWISAEAYCWKPVLEKDLDRYYGLEMSVDGKHFTPLPLKFELIRNLEFNHWRLSNAKPIPKQAKYLRIILKCSDFKQCWVNQLEKIRLSE